MIQITVTYENCLGIGGGCAASGRKSTCMLPESSDQFSVGGDDVDDDMDDDMPMQRCWEPHLIAGVNSR